MSDSESELQTNDANYNTDRFKASFKYYKKKNNLPDFSDVVDFSLGSNSQIERADIRKKTSLAPLTGLLPPEEWEVFQHKQLPGFMFVRNPFLPGYQEYWIQRCLEDFPSKPNTCNLDAHITRKDDDNIWQLSQRPNHSLASRSLTSEKTLLQRLRWVTLGYQHDWNTKQYSQERHSPIPSDLAYMSKYVVDVLGYPPSYQPEASIINYYNKGSTLTGHVDLSEFDLQAPILSISFGLSAIFLVGGTTKDIEPIPMYLRSGDITVLSGDCRLAYHAIPRIIPAPFQPKCMENVSHTSFAQNVRMQCADSEENGKSDAGQCKDSRNLHVDICTSSGITEGRSDSDLIRVRKTISSELPEDRDELQCRITDINDYITEMVMNGSIKFQPFLEHVNSSRINISVRQVFEPGQSFETIKCDGHYPTGSCVKN